MAAFILLLECIILSFFQANGVESRPVGIMLFAVVLFTLGYFWDLGHSKRLKPVIIPLILGYLMRIALVIFDVYGRSVYLLPNSGGDTEMFYWNAIQYALYGYAVRGGLLSTLMGTLFQWIGLSRVFGQFILMLCSIVALHMAERIMEEFRVETRYRIRVMYILCLLPNFAILSSVFLRESCIIMFVAISLMCFAKWFVGKAEYWFWLAFIFVFAGSAFHSGSVAVAVGYIVVRFLYDRSKQKFRFTWKNILPVVIFILIFLFLFNNYGDRLFAKMMNITSIEDIASGVGQGGSSYAKYVGNSSTPLNMILYTPLRVVFFMFSPFPWNWRGLSDIIAFCLNSMFYLVVVFKAVKTIMRRRTPHKNAIIALMIIALCTVFVFAWGCSNTGTAVRHRDKMVVLYGVLMALTWSHRKNRYSRENWK